jgi:hypothetical protein
MAAMQVAVTMRLASEPVLLLLSDVLMKRVPPRTHLSFLAVDEPAPPSLDALIREGLYKLDYNLAGRYLAMHVLFPDYLFVSISGYDADLEVIADR